MKKILFLCLVLAGHLSLSMFAADPVISNIRAAQRPGTKLVDIYYDLSDADGDTVNISALAFEGGAPIETTAFSGTGEGIVCGTDKLIVWDSSVDWDGNFSTNITFAVKASGLSHDGLIAYYPFDGDVLDHSGNENHGSWNGGGFSSGVSGQCYSFDAGQYYRMPGFNNTSSLSAYTVSAWFKGAKTHPHWEAIVSRGQQRVTSMFYLAFTDGEGYGSALYASSSDADAFGTSEYKPAGFLIADWHHYVSTYDGSNLCSYVDGQLVGSNSDARGSVDLTDGKPLYINRHDWSYGWSSRLDGEVDQVRVYRRSLSASEVLQLNQSNK